jgi:hypothetical protein
MMRLAFMTDPFESPWLKWGWAVVESNRLQLDIDGFTNDLKGKEFGRVRADYQPKHHRFAIVLDEIYAELPKRWGLRLGNIVHNYRSCLDHLAWTLVERGKTPPSTLTDHEQQGIYFPIALTREDFNQALRGRRPKLPGVRRTDIAAVRRHQPYKTGKRRAYWHALSVLDRLSRLDKHRTIQPVAGYPATGLVEVTYANDCSPSRQAKNRPTDKLDVGAEFAWIYVRKTGPNPRIRVKAHLEVKPIVDHYLWLNEWFTKTVVVTGRILQEFSDLPKDMLEGLDATLTQTESRALAAPPPKP